MSIKDYKRTTVDIPLDVSEELEAVIGRFGKEYKSKQSFILDAIEEKLYRNIKEISVKTTDIETSPKKEGRFKQEFYKIQGN